jgi:hypothetical protein
MKRMHWNWWELENTPRYVLDKVIEVLSEESDDVEDELNG